MCSCVAKALSGFHSKSLFLLWLLRRQPCAASGVLPPSAGASDGDCAPSRAAAADLAADDGGFVGPMRAGGHLYAAPRRGKDQACLQTSRAQNYPDFGLERQRAAARRQVKFPPAPVSSAWPGFVVPRKWGSGDCAVAQWELCVRCPRQFFGDFLIAQKVTRPAGRNLPCRLGGKIRNQ